MVKLQLSSEISPAQEGFWTKLQHTFTKDSKSAHLIDGLIGKVIRLKPEERDKFLKTKVDFLCLRGDIMLAAASYVGIFAKFMAENFGELKRAEEDTDKAREIYKSLLDKLNKIRANLDRNMDKFALFTEKQSEAEKKNYAVKGKTYGELGFSTSRVLTIAKEFRSQSAGSLKTLKSARWNFAMKTMKASAHGVIGNFAMFYNYSKIAMELYSHIDYFLFYTNKKI